MLPTWEPLWPYRAVLAVDARNFSALNSKSMQQVNADIPLLLEQALKNVGVHDWERRVFPQHTGDGYVAGMDPKFLPALVGCFPEALRASLIRRRAEVQREAPLQLRVSIHVGPLPESGLGVPMVHTHRLLDDNALRNVLESANPEMTNTAVLISQRAYEDVVESGCVQDGSLRHQFTRNLVKVKKFQQLAWLHIPNFDMNLANPEIFEPVGTTEAVTERSKSSAPAAPEAVVPTPGTVNMSHKGEHGIQGYNLFGAGWSR